MQVFSRPCKAKQPLGNHLVVNGRRHQEPSVPGSARLLSGGAYVKKGRQVGEMSEGFRVVREGPSRRLPSFRSGWLLSSVEPSGQVHD